MIGCVNYDRVRSLPGFIKLFQQPAKLSVNGTDMSVIAEHLFSDLVRAPRYIWPELEIFGIVEPLHLFGSIGKRRVRRVPGEREHPRPLAVPVDELQSRIGHEGAVVALRLELRTAVGIEGKRLVEMRVGIRPYVPVVKALPRRTFGNKGATFIALREMPLSDVASTIAGAPECFSQRLLVGTQLNRVVDDSGLVRPTAGEQHGSIRRTHGIVRNALIERYPLLPESGQDWRLNLLMRLARH